MKYRNFFGVTAIIGASCLGAGYSMAAKGDLKFSDLSKYFTSKDKENTTEIKINKEAPAANTLVNETNLSEEVLKSNCGNDGFAPLVEKLMPSVVSVVTSKKVENAKNAMMVDKDIKDFLEKFFPFGDIPGFKEERQNPRGGGGGGSGASKEVTFGSGVVIDSEGYIVTNNHVIDNTDEITIKFNDGTQLKAILIGKDEVTDLALLQVKSKKPLAYADFGNSEKSKVGSQAIAIGNPFGLGGSVSVGIVSAIARDINAGPYDNFIQTDAAINRGHSGGPLFNACGEIIGINTAIISPSGGNVGIGFAIPSNIVIPIIEKLRKGETINRGYIGVKVQMISPEIAESLGMEETFGALVADVVRHGPSDKAGLRSGDIIIECNHQPIKLMRDLPKIISQISIGSEVPLLVIRNGKKEKLHIKISEAPKAAVKSNGKPISKEAESIIPTKSFEFGVKVADLTDEYRVKLPVEDKDLKGIIITEVMPNGVADQFGLRENDIILQVGGLSRGGFQEALNIDSFEEYVNKMIYEKKDKLSLLLYRFEIQGNVKISNKIYISLDIGKNTK